MNTVSDTPGRSHSGGLPALVAIFAAFVSLAAFTEGRADLPSGFTDELVVGGFSEPVGIAFLPDGRMLVIEQRAARIKLVRFGPPATVDSVGKVPQVNASGNERGLLGIAVDPQWPARPYVYTHSTHAGNKVRISRFTASGALSSPTGLISLDTLSRFDLLNDIPDNANNHNGGTVRFGPEGMLYVSLGEDGNERAAQDTSSLRGVLLRLQTSTLPAGPGTATRAQITPADNPFSSVGGLNARLLWAWGLRNPFRFQIDPPTGRILISDVGQDSWEELNEQTSGGRNFGWPRFENTSTFDSGSPLVGSPTPPIYAMSHSADGVAAGISVGVYRRIAGAQHAFPVEYDGDAFMTDYYAGMLRRLKRSGSTWSIAPEVPGQPSPQDWGTDYIMASDWALGTDGGLYYCRTFAVPFSGLGSIRRIIGAESVSVEEPAPSVTFAKPYPLPATGSVEFDWTLATPARVSLVLHDVRGRRVRALVADREDGAGRFHAAWDGLDEDGRRARPGVYFVRLSVNGQTFQHRVPLLR